MWYPCILNDMVPSDACHLHTLCPWMRAPGTSNREKKWVKNEDFTENACPRTFNKTGYIWKTEKSRVCCKIQSNLTLKSYLQNPKTLYIIDIVLQIICFLLLWTTYCRKSMSEQGSNESDHEEADNGQQQIQDPSMPIDSGICRVADDVRTLGLKFATTTGIFNSSYNPIFPYCSSFTLRLYPRLKMATM